MTTDQEMDEMVASRDPPLRFSLRILFVVVTVVAVMLAFLWPAVRAASERSQRMVEPNRFKNIALALHNYHEQWKAFPPAVQVDTNGIPFRSWRVQVVDYVQAGPLFGYQYSQPWNSPTNDALCRTDGYRHLFLPGASANTPYTNVMMPLGPGTVGEQSVSLKDITDDHAQTILVMALKPSDILWHEPRDLSLSEITRAPGDPNRIVIRGRLFQGAHCALVDGSVHWLPADLPYDTLMAMLTIAGGEEVDMSWQSE